MYYSLLKVCKDFQLFVYAFDDVSYNFLRNGKYSNLTVISLGEFEDEQLLKVKPARTSAEYCWTCSSSTILHAIEHYHLDHCTYIDADLIFYADPSILIEEMGSDSVMITDHRYTPKYDQTATSGRYCVQFVTFKNDLRGLQVLKWWRNACLEWCYARFENGKFGDQKYLDDWVVRFAGVHELQHLGGGIAPWNVQQYHFIKRKGNIFGKEKATGKRFPVVFYHFHGFRFYKDNIVLLTGQGYYITKNGKKLFYFPYLHELNQIKHHIQCIDMSFDPHGATENAPLKPHSILGGLRRYLSELYHNPKGIVMNRSKTFNHFYSAD